MPCGAHCSSGTNLDGVGLASVDRNNRATLPLTAPSRAIKSSAKDLSQRIVKLPFGCGGHRALPPRTPLPPSCDSGPREVYSYPTTMCWSKNRRFPAWILT